MSKQKSEVVYHHKHSLKCPVKEPQLRKEKQEIQLSTVEQTND